MSGINMLLFPFRSLRQSSLSATCQSLPFLTTTSGVTRFRDTCDFPYGLATTSAVLGLSSLMRLFGFFTANFRCHIPYLA